MGDTHTYIHIPIHTYIYIHTYIFIYIGGGDPLLTLRMFRVAWGLGGRFFNDHGGGFSLVLRSGLASREGDLLITLLNCSVLELEQLPGGGVENCYVVGQLRRSGFWGGIQLEVGWV